MLFRIFIFAWLVATGTFYHLPELPEPLSIITLMMFMALVSIGLKNIDHQFSGWQRSLLSFLAGFIIGICVLYWQAFFTSKIDENMFDRPVMIQAQVQELPIWQQSGANHPKKLKLVLGVSTIADISTLPKLSVQQFSANLPQVQLSWYLKQGAKPEDFGLSHWPKLGQTLWLSAKFKQPRGQSNPGSFDYERYLFAKGIKAKGYVKKLSIKGYQSIDDWLSNGSLAPNYNLKTEHQKIKDSLTEYQPNDSRVLAFMDDHKPANLFHIWRTHLYQQINQLFANSEFLPIIQALTTGERAGVTAQDWQLFKTTGTIHLMAISGLHIGIAALFGYGVFWGVWKLMVFRLQSIDLWQFAKVGALLMATFYAYLSGFSVATERAWLMVVIGILFLFLQKPFGLWNSYFLALWVVLLWQPTAILLQGFWLSFLAVALIFICLPALKSKPKWQQFLWLQLVLSIGLLPALIYFFGAIPSYGFLANLFALPWISIIVMPILFISALLLMLFPVKVFEPMSWWHEKIDWLFEILWIWLNWVEKLPYSLVLIKPLSAATVVLIYGLLLVGLLFWSKANNLSFIADDEHDHGFRQLKSWQRFKKRLALLQQPSVSSLTGGVLQRPLKVMMILLGCGLASWWFWQSAQVARPKPGSFNLNVLDVGQGLAIVVETQNKTLLYDLGAYWGPKMDGSRLAVLPYLQSQSVHKVDRLIVSHSDSDHAGGLSSLYANLPVLDALSGQAAELNKRVDRQPFKTCQQGQTWQWDGVTFKMLAPLPSWLKQKNLADNDHSCVLQISTGRYKVLITGDLSARYEKKLLANMPANNNPNPVSSLDSTILIAGHHGSRHSSSAAFLDSVDPLVVLISAGYKNRFGFPDQALVSRLESRNIKMFNTACSGAMRWQVTRSGVELSNQSRYRQSKWYYQPCHNNTF